VSIVLYRRAELGLTQVQLAERAEVGRKTILRLERGMAPSAVVAGKVAAALGIDVATLLEGIAAQKDAA
jgi:transcriptional regulator with XRE-family HTH domain